MRWEDQLQPASFRGVSFQADSLTEWGGREKIVRTYPFKDKPTIQDVGGVSKPGQFSAYVFGEDAFDKRDELERALNKPGAGDLILPWRPLRRVEIIGEFTIRHSTVEGGLVRFDIEFIDAVDTVYPQATENTARATVIKIQEARASAIDDFKNKFSIDGITDWAKAQGLTTVTDAVGAINNTVNKLLTKPEGYLLFETKFRLFSNSLGDAIAAPDTLALGILDMMKGLSSLGDNFTDALARHKTLFNWRSNYEESPSDTPTRQREKQNNEAVETLIQTGAVLVAAESIAQTDFTAVWNYADAMAWRNEMNTAFQTLMERADSNAFQQLLDVMTSLSNDMVTRSRHLGRITTIKTRHEYMPALLLSYEQYGSIDYADEIVANNGIAHPLFIEPGSTLELISHD